MSTRAAASLEVPAILLRLSDAGPSERARPRAPVFPVLTPSTILGGSCDCPDTPGVGVSCPCAYREYGATITAIGMVCP